VITIIAFIILGGAAILGFIPMQDGSPAPGLSKITARGWFPHGGLPILMTMVAVNFTFSGTGLIGIAADETENPHKIIPVAIRTTIARLIIFFIGTVFVLAALSVSMLGGVLALFSSVVAPDTVFVALSAISGFAVMAVWISICAAHFVFRRRHLQAGKTLADLQYRAPWYPLVPVLSFVLCLVACVRLAFDPGQRIALYCGLSLVALCYGAYFLTRPKTPLEPEHVAE